MNEAQSPVRDAAWFCALSRVEFGFAFGFYGQVVFALEAARGNAGKRVEHAQAVEGIGGDGFAKGVGTEFDECLADEGGGDFVGGLKTFYAGVLTGQIDSQFLPETAIFETLLFIEPVLVSARFPGGETLVGEAFGGFAEFFDDLEVGNAVRDHQVKLIASGFG